MTDEARIDPRELVAELVLGVLPEAEAARVRAYLETDADARSEYEEMANVARLLPLAAEDRPPQADLLPGILERVSAEPIPFSRLEARRSNRWFVGFGAAAAAILVAVTGVAGFALGRSGGEGGGDLQAQVDGQSELLQSVAFGRHEATTATDGALRVAVVRAPGASNAYTYVEGMPSLAEGQAFQSWFIAEGQSPVPGPLFTVRNGSIWLEAGDSLDQYAFLAFTVEHEDGADAPSQDPFVIVPLQKAAKH